MTRLNRVTSSLLHSGAISEAGRFGELFERTSSSGRCFTLEPGVSQVASLMRGGFVTINYPVPISLYSSRDTFLCCSPDEALIFLLNGWKAKIEEDARI